MINLKHLQIQREGPVEQLVLNRPGVRNAFNEDLIAELTAWAGRAACDAELRVVVLRGAGPAFCSGADLGWMAKMAAYSQEDNIRDARAAAGMFSALNNLPVPVIARVHGAALGGGAGLVAIADIAVADAATLFGFTEVKIGLLPAIIAPYVLAKIGMSAARELFLTGRRFTADHAREIGLVHTVVPGDALDAAVQKAIGEVLGGGREAIAAAKALLRRIGGYPSDETANLTIDAIATQRTTPEAQERMKRFLEKHRRSD